MLALVNLIKCKLFQSFYKHEIFPCNSFHIPSVLKTYGRVCRETNRKCNLLSSENLQSLHSCIYASAWHFASVRLGKARKRVIWNIKTNKILRLLHSRNQQICLWLTSIAQCCKYVSPRSDGAPWFPGALSGHLLCLNVKSVPAGELHTAKARNVH